MQISHVEVQLPSLDVNERTSKSLTKERLIASVLPERYHSQVV